VENVANETQMTEKEEALKRGEEIAKDTGEEIAANQGNEFKITVRKLDMPVRPRGVLAE
jgi:hypothetical protein